MAQIKSEIDFVKSQLDWANEVKIYRHSVAQVLKRNNTDVTIKYSATKLVKIARTIYFIQHSRPDNIDTVAGGIYGTLVNIMKYLDSIHGLDRYETEDITNNFLEINNISQLQFDTIFNTLDRNTEIQSVLWPSLIASDELTMVSIKYFLPRLSSSLKWPTYRDGVDFWWMENNTDNYLQKKMTGLPVQAIADEHEETGFFKSLYNTIVLGDGREEQIIKDISSGIQSGIDSTSSGVASLTSGVNSVASTGTSIAKGGYDLASAGAKGGYDLASDGASFLGKLATVPGDALNAFNTTLKYLPAAVIIGGSVAVISVVN